MSLSVPIQNKTYNVGQQNIPQRSVPAGTSRMVMTLDVTNWTNPAAQLSITLEFSNDGGVTWFPGGGVSGLGPNANGQFISPRGQPLTTVKVLDVNWPADVTDMRGSITISGGSIQTGGSIDIT
jgi:hypothetical protein